LNTAIKYIMKYKTGVNVMKQISTSSEEQLKNADPYDVGLQDRLTLQEIQTILAIAHFKLQERAQDLSHLVQYTKIDTKKQGKTIVEQDAYMSNFNDLLDPKRSPFEYESIRNMITGSFIQQKTETAIKATKDLMSS